MFILEIGETKWLLITIKMIGLPVSKDELLWVWGEGGILAKDFAVKMKIVFMRLWKKNEGKIL